MEKDLQNIKICFCEADGECIFEYTIGNPLTALVPNVGDMVDVDGTFREVTERKFLYEPKTIIVMITLKEIKEPKPLFSFE